MGERSDYTLSVDWGSTYLKSSLFDGGLARLAEGSVPVRYKVREAGRVELDASEMWESTAGLMRQTCTAAGIEPCEITRVALTGQAQTFAILDAAGRPLTPFLSWLDRRAVEEPARIAEELGVEFHQHCSFPHPTPLLQACKVLWLRRNHPELLGPGARVAPLTGLLALRLAGVNATDRNLAAMSGLYSLRAGGWWAGALRACGLRAEQLPALLDVGARLTARVRCEEIAFRPGLEVLFAGNDQTAGAFGNDCRRAEMVVTLGTALVAYRYAGDLPGPYSPDGCWGPYPGGGFYELAVQDEGTSAMDRARGQLLPGQDIGAFMSCAESAWAARRSRRPGAKEVQKGEGDEVFFYPGRMGPGGAWVGAGDRDVRALAVLEGISFALRRLIVEDLRCGSAESPVCVIGGGSKSRFWLQLLADVLNCPVRRGEGDALLGAAAMARPGMRPPTPDRSDLLLPDGRRAALYDDLYRKWRANR